MKQALPLRLQVAQGLYIIGFIGFVAAVLGALVMASQAASHEPTLSWWWPGGGVLSALALLKAGQGMLGPEHMMGTNELLDKVVWLLRFGLRFAMVLALPLVGACVVTFEPDVSYEARMGIAAAAVLVMGWLMWEVRGWWPNRLRWTALGAVLLLCATGLLVHVRA